jgi:hypothetical protein
MHLLHPFPFFANHGKILLFPPNLGKGKEDKAKSRFKKKKIHLENLGTEEHCGRWPPLLGARLRSSRFPRQSIPPPEGGEQPPNPGRGILV